MITKKCTKCLEDKELSEYYKHKGHKYDVMSYCKECFNKKCIQRWINRKVFYVNKYGGECTDCHIKLSDSHYSIFEFHHLDPTQKDYDWNFLRKTSNEKIVKELDKCVLLCANCHRIRHAKL